MEWSKITNKNALVSLDAKVIWTAKPRGLDKKTKASNGVVESEFFFFHLFLLVGG